MDPRTFDRLAAGFARAASRRGVLAALAGLLAGGAIGSPADAKGKRRHECGPDKPCASGYDCVKQGRKRRCVCPSGITCDGACCAAGEACRDGRCAAQPPACIPFGEPCKNAGRPCCDGLACGSGQGGEDDVACHVPAGGACETSAQCVFGSQCRMGLCVADPMPSPEPDLQCTVCASGCPHTTIEAAIADAGLSTITVSAGAYREHDLIIGRNLTLEACGNGPVTIDAEEQGRVLAIPDEGHVVTVRGLNLVNGRADGSNGGNGGCIYTGVGCTLTVEDSAIENCSAVYTDPGSGFGGGIYNREGTLTVRRSSITGCEASVYGGGIANESGNATGMLTVEDSTFEKCSAAESGGGIHNEAGSLTVKGTTTITDCSATGNLGSGGGIFNQGGTPGGTVTLQGVTTITGCNAQNRGGGIGNKDGTVTLEGTAKVTGCRSNRTASSAGGGGIANVDGMMTLLGDTEINECHAGYAGGGIANKNGTLTVNGDTEITGCTAVAGGGGIATEGGTVTLEGKTTITVCTAALGAGIFNLGGQVTCEEDDNVSVTGNSTVDCAGADNTAGWKAIGEPCGCGTNA